MITFKITKQSFIKNSFFTRKTTPMAKTLNSFGYLKSIDKKGNVIAEWYDNFVKVELTFKMKELTDNYKSIYPYYNSKFVRGNIWKYSYNTLLTKIHKDLGFSDIKVDKITYKKLPIKGNNVIVTDAVYVLSNNITKLQGKLKSIKNNIYTIVTEEGVFDMGRTSFNVLPQDYFILLSIRCN